MKINPKNPAKKRATAVKKRSKSKKRTSKQSKSDASEFIVAQKLSGPAPTISL